VMVDRRAITFRTLAVAALVVMLVAPEAVVHPSFQMSFAATLGLVALMDRDRALVSLADNSGVARAALWGGREVALLLLASFVAGLATMPYAAFHFHRATPYGVLANLLAMPVVSGLVMPAGLLGLLAMPFGFDGVFWRLMELGIGWMIWVSQWVAGLPGAVGRIPAFGVAPVLLATLGIVAICLLRTRLRWLGRHLAQSIVGSAVLVVLAGLAIGTTASITADLSLSRVLLGAVVQMPAVWVLAGLACLLVGLLPRATVAAWVAAGACLGLWFFGSLLGLSDAVLRLSPFEHVPQVPGGTVTAAPLVTLSVLGLLLTVAGLVGIRRRDIG